MIFELKAKFEKDAIEEIVKSAIKTTVGNCPYKDGKISGWTNGIMESCLIALTKLQRPFKYIGKFSRFSKLFFSKWQKRTKIKNKLSSTVLSLE